MNDDEARGLGLRAVACNGWRWLPGMSPGGSMLAHRVLGMCSDGSVTVGYLGTGECWQSDGMAGSWPDFRDPATLGCLLALVREVWAEAVRRSDLYEAQVVVVETRWESCRRARWVVCPDGGRFGAIGAGATEAEALVAALEDAPTATLDP